MCTWEGERERGRAIFGISSESSGCERSAFSGKKLKKTRADFLPALGPSHEEFAHWRQSTSDLPLPGILYSSHSSFLLSLCALVNLQGPIKTEIWLEWDSFLYLSLLPRNSSPFLDSGQIFAVVAGFPPCATDGGLPCTRRGARASAAFGGVWQNSRWHPRTKHLKMVLASSAVFKQHFGLWTRLVRTIFFLFSVSEESLHLCFPLLLPMWAHVSPEMQQQEQGFSPGSLVKPRMNGDPSGGDRLCVQQRSHDTGWDFLQVVCSFHFWVLLRIFPVFVSTSFFSVVFALEASFSERTYLLNFAQNLSVIYFFVFFFLDFTTIASVSCVTFACLITCFYILVDLLKKFFLLIYNVILVSGVQQSESVIHISTLFLDYFPI